MLLTVDIFGTRHEVREVNVRHADPVNPDRDTIELRIECGNYAAMLTTRGEAAKWVSIVEPIACPTCVAHRDARAEGFLIERA